jgi:hypothetical protein
LGRAGEKLFPISFGVALFGVFISTGLIRIIEKLFASGCSVYIF